MNEHRELDILFDLARNQEPEVSFETTKNLFLSTMIVSAGGVLATKGILKVLTVKKWIIMMSLVSVATTTAVVSSLVFSENKIAQSNEPIHEESSLVAKTQFVVENNMPFVEESMPILTEVDSEAAIVYVKKELNDTPKVFACMGEPIPMEYGNDSELSPPFLFNSDFMASEPSDMMALNFGDPIPTVYHNCFTKTDDGIHFKITENTTIEELENIQSRAIDAGIDFSYTAKIKDNQIKKLNLQINWEYEGNSSNSNVNITTDGKCDGFTYEFGWIENKEGQAIELSFENNCEVSDVEESLEDLEDDLEDILDDVDDLIEDLEFEGEDSGVNLGGDFWNDFDAQFDALELEIEKLLVQVNSLMDSLDIEKLNEEAESLIEESELKIENIEEEIEALEQKMEEAIEEKLEGIDEKKKD